MPHQIIAHANFAKGFRGGERQTQLLIQQLSHFGYSQRLLVRKNSELGARCAHISKLEIIEISKPYVLHVRQLKGVSLLHAHETKAAQFAFFAHLLLKIPYMLTRRVDNPITPNYFNKMLYEKAAYSVGLSKAIVAEILSVSPKASCHIIPSAFSGFDVDEATALQIKERFEGCFVIGHIGALDDKHKGQSYLIRAFLQLVARYSDMRLLLLGRGADEAMLKSLANQDERIIFEGFVNNVGDYLAAMDLFVFPSLNEGLGSTLLDVMDAKVPIAASNVGGIPDIISHNENGWLFEAKNVDAIVKAIEMLYHDPLTCKRYRDNAYQNIKAYSAIAMAQHYRHLYNVLEQNASRKRIVVFAQNRNFFGAHINHIPLLEQLKTRYPNSHIYLISKNAMSQMFETLQLVDKTFIIQSKWQMLLRYRALNPHITLNLQRNSMFINLMTSLFHKNKTIGYRNGWSRWFYDQSIPHNSNIYRAQNYLNLIGANLQPYHGDRYDRILLMPGAGGAHKRWALEHYIALAQKLQQRYPHFEIDFVVGAQENDLVPIIQNAGFNIYNNLEITALFALIKGSKLVIANDCGPSHMAQIYKIPIIILHSDETLSAASTLREWFYPHDGARALVSEAGKSINSIKTEEVFSEACKLLKHLYDIES